MKNSQVRSDIPLYVRHIMNAGATCCSPDTSIREIAGLMVAHDCGEIPILTDRRSRKPAGVVTARDIVCRLVAKGRNPLDAAARDCMTSPAITVTPDTDLKTCVDIMSRHQIRRVPVVDDEGRVCGMVAQADIATRAQPEFTAEVTERVSQPSEAASRAGH